MGLTWSIYISFLDADKITFLNEGIQFQMPLLLVVVLLKYIVLFICRYKTSTKLFYINLVGYLIFLVAVYIIDYYQELFGKA